MECIYFKEQKYIIPFTIKNEMLIIIVFLVSWYQMTKKSHPVSLGTIFIAFYITRIY